MANFPIPSRKFIFNLLNRRYFIPLLKTHLPIFLGQTDSYKWIETGSGLKLRGPETNREQRIVHRLFRLGRLFPVEYFGIIDELVDRYDVPRSFGGETLLSHASRGQAKYRPYRDSFSDFDRDTVAYLMEVGRPNRGDFALDVGAYHGMGTLRLLEEVGESGFVLALEGDPDYCKILSWNLAQSRFTNFLIRSGFVSSLTGKKLNILLNDNPMVRSLEHSTLNDLGLRNLRYQEVLTTTVDDIIYDAGMRDRELNYVTLTVNGHELSVLQGMEDAIGRSSRLVISIAGWYFVEGVKVANTVSPWLIRRGFKVFVGRRGRVIAVKI